MKIIHVLLGKANPDRMNGVNKVVHQMATKQHLYQYDIEVWGITKNLNHDYPQRNFTTKLFPSAMLPFQLHPLLKNAIAAQHKNTVFHLHGGYSHVMYAVSQAISAHGFKYIHTPHGAYNILARDKSKFRKKMYEWMFEKRLIHGAKKIHCIGASEVVGLQQIMPSAPYALIPYGFDTPLKLTENMKNKAFTLSFCGRLDMHTKGLDILLEAFQSVKKAIPQAKLALIGDGPDRQKLENMARELQLDDVTFYGAKFGDEKDQLLAQSHVFVHPSRYEGLPSAVIEAANLGLPCVLTTATNMAQYIDHYRCGVTISKPSAVLLASAIIDMKSALDTKGQDFFERNAKNMVASSFNWEVIVHELDTIYETI